MALKIYLKFKIPSYIFSSPSVALHDLCAYRQEASFHQTELNLHNLLSCRTVGPREGGNLRRPFCGIADLREGRSPALTPGNHDVTFPI
jgi:hypothetical protein